MPSKTRRHAARKQSSGSRGFIEPQPDERLDPDRVYTFEAAAAHLQTTARCVRNLVDAGRLGYLQINQKARRIPGHEIVNYKAREERRALRP